MQVPQLGTFEMAWPRPVRSVAAKLADATALARRQQIEIMAKAAAQPSPFSWHRAKVSNGVGNPYEGKMRTGEIGAGQISNGETDIQITAQEAERLNAIRGITVTKLAKAPVLATTFKHPAAA